MRYLFAMQRCRNYFDGTSDGNFFVLSLNLLFMYSFSVIGWKMLKLSSCLFFVIAGSTCARSPSMSVPIIFDNNRIPTISIRYPFSQSSRHTIHLGKWGRTYVDRADGPDRLTYIPTIAIDDEFNMPRLCFPHRSHSLSHILERGDFLGAGPGSDLLRAGESVSILRHRNSSRGFLVLSFDEMDENQFLSEHCYTNASVRFPFQVGSESIIDGLVSLDSPVHVDTTNVRVEIMSGQNDTVTWYQPLEYYMSAHPYVMTLPFPIFINAFSPSIPNIVSDNFRFENCSHIRVQLPSISLTVESGSIRLFPEDYTRMESGDSCEILIRPQNGTFIYGLNLLMIENLNIHVNSRQVLVCDALL